jgi:NAD+ kinase
MQNIGLIVNRDKLEAITFAHQVIAFLTERDKEVVVDADSAPLIGRCDLAAKDDLLMRQDLLITLGGDGTILAASHLGAPAGVPILGVHMGRFGFIAEARPDTLFAELENVLDGRGREEQRMMLRGTVWRGGSQIHTSIGLNEVVLSKGARARMLELDTQFAGGYQMHYPADGVVVSTPTGSTAYALSAGGPLVSPTVQALLVVPICPHTLSARPLVVPAEERLRVRVSGEDALFSADGTNVLNLLPGDIVEIARAEFCTRLVVCERDGFYRKLRKRLLWGERLNI